METQDGIPLGFRISGLLSSAEVLQLIQVVGELCKSWTNSRQKNDCECDECDESVISQDNIKGFYINRHVRHFMHQLEPFF